MTSTTTTSHPKHRKYRLTAFEDNYCWVQSLSDGISHKCFPLTHSIGDEFWLFERSSNIFNGSISFRYSVLNLYKVGEVYFFDVLRDEPRYFKVSNHEHLEFAAPLSCRNNPLSSKEELLVADLDLDDNKPVFANPKSLNAGHTDAFEVDYSVFESGKVYELPVIKRYTNKNGNIFLVAVYKSSNYHISVPAKYANIDFGNTIECNLGYYDIADRPALKLTRSFIVKKLYEEKKKYPFRIMKFVQDEAQATLSWIVEDQYGYSNMYHPDNDLSRKSYNEAVKVGDEVELYVWKITSRGYLTLVHELSDVKTSKYFAEDVFNEIGLPGFEKDYFFVLQREEDSEEGENDDTQQSYISQYHEGENLWIFSYFSFLDEKINSDLEDGEFAEAQTLLDIYIRLERWLVYSSDYLKNFLPFRAKTIIEKAEGKIRTLEAKQEAITLFLNDLDQEFVSEVKKQLSNTRYLPAKKIAVLREVIRISDFFVEDSDNNDLFDVILLLLKNNLISQWDRYAVSRAIEKKIVSERERIIDLYIEEENSAEGNELKTLLIYQHLLLFLWQDSLETVRLKYASVNLLRFLAVYSGDREFLRLAINLIVFDGFLKPNLSIHTDVFKLASLDFKEMAFFNQPAKKYFKGKGRLLLDAEGLSIIPQNHLVRKPDRSPNQIASLSDLEVSVKSYDSQDIISKQLEMGDLIKKIRAFLSYVRLKPEPAPVNVSIEEFYTGKVKSIGSKNVYCFLTLKINNEEISPLLHVNSFNKSKFFNDINVYLKPYDRITFNILKIDGKNISISPAQLLINHAASYLKENKTVLGIVTEKYKSSGKIITEDGLPVVIKDETFQQGMVVRCDVTGYNAEEHFFLGENAQIMNVEFGEDPVELYRKYLSEAGVLNHVVQREKKEKAVPEYEHDFDFRLLTTLLINCIEQYRKFVEDEKENALYFFILASLCAVVKSSKSYYYANKLESLANIYKIAESETLEDLVSVADQTDNLSIQDDFQHDLLAFKLLRYFGSDAIDIPVSLEVDSRFYRLKKLIEANNLLKQFHDNGLWSNHFKNLVIKELYAVALDKEIDPIKEVISLTLDSDFDLNQNPKKISSNLGSESKTREFKTSVFFSASDEPQDKVILRTISGFLNGYDDASLFIGVNDSGDVVGLRKDLQHNPNIKNLDQFQNYIQSLVVGAFPKEVNRHLDFIFHRINNLDYLEIFIPKYDKPVSFNNEFYQRQGVQTRILKGNDLTDFMFRKATGLQNLNVNDKDGTYDTQVDDQQLIKNEIVSDHTISEKQLRIDYYEDQKTVTRDITELPEISERDLLAYLYFYKDGSYIVSLRTLDDYMHKIPITEKFRFGYLMMCYDNACVNKVEIRSILSKNFNRKYLNGVSGYGKLLAILPANKDFEIIVTTSRNGQEFIKMMHISKISTHRILGLKGNCIVQDDFDFVVKYWVNATLPVDFDPFRRDSKQGLGAQASKFGRMHRILTKYLEA